MPFDGAKRNQTNATGQPIQSLSGDQRNKGNPSLVQPISADQRGRVISSSAAPADPITSGMISYWKADEASGTLIDSFGSNTMTNNNTVGATTGKVGGARQFAYPNSRYFSLTDNAAMRVHGTDFTFTGWFYFTNDGSGDHQVIVAKHDFADRHSYVFYWNGTQGKLALLLSDDLTDPTAASQFMPWGPVTFNTAHFFACGLDLTNNLMFLNVDDGTPVTAAHTTGALDTNAPFMIGGTMNSAVPSFFWGGWLDNITFHKRLLTAAEQTRLYNSGNGLAIPGL
jgi:hypothetical protein